MEPLVVALAEESWVLNILPYAPLAIVVVGVSGLLIQIGIAVWSNRQAVRRGLQKHIQLKYALQAIASLPDATVKKIVAMSIVNVGSVPFTVTELKYSWGLLKRRYYGPMNQLQFFYPHSDALPKKLEQSDECSVLFELHNFPGDGGDIMVEMMAKKSWWPWLSAKAVSVGFLTSDDDEFLLKLHPQLRHALVEAIRERKRQRRQAVSPQA